MFYYNAKETKYLGQDSQSSTNSVCKRLDRIYRIQHEKKNRHLFLGK